MATTGVVASEARGPVLFAYDGSELAAFAIEQAGRELATGREALVLCVWQPADVGFVLTAERRFDADQASQVQAAAEDVAARGATLAEKAGFRSQEPSGRGLSHLERDRRDGRGGQSEPDCVGLPSPAWA